ncbi:hypothetical protein BDV33DRAFT_59400 [Aspergillus novoparasiticus]|uniref:Uncharacterized protein n=1 Tax=Aspergillus novoparasiticus TaxID=986946 RepID=A0A5N6F1K7_9EURO|nr:hypothetical protein BDV33DRAFT_59400 [Aspergillus novoparasiticus]
MTDLSEGTANLSKQWHSLLRLYLCYLPVPTVLHIHCFNHLLFNAVQVFLVLTTLLLFMIIPIPLVLTLFIVLNILQHSHST